MTANNKEIAALLREGLAADIWYDARQFGEDATADTITRVREAMEAAAALLDGSTHKLVEQPAYGAEDAFRRYAEEARAKGNHGHAQRLETEGIIARAIVDKALAEGIPVSVNDGEDTTVHCSRDRDEIIAALFSTDEDYLYIHRPGGVYVPHIGWIRLIYGNNGWDVVSDYTVDLDDWLAPITALAERLETEHGSR